jgi:phage terminase Nu1 subunit (DNA packaging protein)
MPQKALIVPKGTAARVLGIAVRTFERLEQLEVIKPRTQGKRGKAGTYDLAVVVQAYIRRQAEEKPESPRDARDRSQAELNRLRLAKERRALLPREAVVSEGQAYVAAATAKLRSIPARAAQAGIVGEDKRGALEDLVEETLGELARWATALELLQAVDDEGEAA